MPTWDGVNEARQEIKDFSGGIVSDNPVKTTGNELLQAKNIVVSPRGGFEKRKGSELLSSGYGVDTESDIWAWVFAAYDGDPSSYNYYYAYIAKGNINTSAERDIIIDCCGDWGETGNVAQVQFTKAELDAWFVAWIAKGTSEGWISNYSYKVPTACNASGVQYDIPYVTCLEIIDDDLVVTDTTVWGSVYNNVVNKHSISAVYDLKNDVSVDILNDNLTGKQRTDSLNYCVMGLMDIVFSAVTPALTHTAYYAVDQKITSMCELQRRNTTTNVHARILLATMWINRGGTYTPPGSAPSSPLADIAVLYKLTTSGTTLTITGKTELSDDLYAAGKPVWAMFQNRAMMVSGTNTSGDRLWTDGTTAYQLGITPPATAFSAAANTGVGVLTAGVYRVAYSYYRSDEYGCDSNILESSVTVNIAGGNDYIDGTIKYSADPQVDYIRLWRTKVGGAVFYLDGTIANVVGTGTVATTWGVTVADNVLATLAGSTGAGNDNDRPPLSNFIVQASNRMFYFTENHGYWSRADLPENVPADNLRGFDPDDGESITGAVAFMQYILVFKKTKTWIWDANYPDQQKPLLISSNIGCIQYNTIKVCSEGQTAIWLSQQGFFMTDGVKVWSICKEQIYKDLMKNVDKSEVTHACAVYHPESDQYICYVPYLNSKYRNWVYTIQNQCWVQYEYPWVPNFMTLWSDTNSIKRFIIGTIVSGVEQGARSYFAEFIQADKESHYKDVLYVGTCAAPSVSYQNITMTAITNFDDQGAGEVDKSFKQLFIDWQAHAATTATVYVRTKFGESVSSAITYTHEGIQNEPADANWELGYDYIQGWDYQELETAPNNHSISHISELVGKNHTIKFTEASDSYVRVFRYIMTFKPGPTRVE